MFKTLLTNSRIADMGLVGFGETFDKYVLRIYKVSDHICFIWEDLKAESFFSERIEYSAFQNVLEGLHKKLNDSSKEKNWD